MKVPTACVAAIALTLALSQIAPASQSGPARASVTKTVNIAGFQFRPSTLNVEEGTRVVFSNTSGVAHTATDRGAFDTGRIKAGRAAAVRFEERGTFRYHCKIHPEMRGKVVVG